MVTVTNGLLPYRVGLGGGGGFWSNPIWEPGRGGAGGSSQVGNIVAGGGGGGMAGYDRDYCSRSGGTGGSGDTLGTNGQDDGNQHLPGTSQSTNGQIFGPGTGGWAATPICFGGAQVADNGKAGMPGLIRISW